MIDATGVGIYFRDFVDFWLNFRVFLADFGQYLRQDLRMSTGLGEMKLSL